MIEKFYELWAHNKYIYIDIATIINKKQVNRKHKQKNILKNIL
jgi:hypothetical protein